MAGQDTTSAEKALKLRELVKKKKPDFVRQENWRYRRLKENWRRPRGLDNKMRRKIKGWPPTVSVGYRGPKVARGLHPSGYNEVLLYNAAGLQKIDPKTQAIRIAHAVGKRKRTKILLEARKRKITILNFREAKELTEEEKPTEEKEEIIEEKEKAEEKEATEKPKRKRVKTKKRKGVVENSDRT
jgi:large subunit ribosomal protein L32e